MAKDPIINALPLGDLFPPLIKVSDIYGAIEDNEIIGVCTIYHAFSMPSLVFGATGRKVKQELVKRTLREIPDKFLSICSPEDTCLLNEYSITVRSHPEHQMTATFLAQVEEENVEAKRVRKDELSMLDRFYLEHRAEAWSPIQFKAGPYYCVKHNGVIVSAAGVHLVAPQIAQLGNIVTDKAYRNRGFATACTAALASDLTSKGRIISLFVRVENEDAVHLYEKLGFRKTRDVNLLLMQKAQEKP